MAYFGTSDGARIFYTDTGEGKPVLLHGWACDGNDWSWQGPELENRYRVIIVDHRGHGRSTAPQGSYRPQVRGPSPSAVAAEMFGQAFYTPDTPGFLKAWHRRRVLATPDHVVAGCLLGLYEGDEGLGRAVVARDYLRQRKVPRLAVYASEPATWLERDLSRGERDEIHVIEGGHFLHQQMSGEFNRLALGWLDALP